MAFQLRVRISNYCRRQQNRVLVVYEYSLSLCRKWVRSVLYYQTGSVVHHFGGSHYIARL